MDARAAAAFAALAILAVNSQPTVTTWVEVAPTTSEEQEEIERRYTPELIKELTSVKDKVLLLYTEYSARAGSDLKKFHRQLSEIHEATIKSVNSSVLDDAPDVCRSSFTNKTRKIVTDFQRAASFNIENHHKFLLGHMIVFRMHLNKSEDYIKKCEKVIKLCGIKCETNPRVKRWRQLALDEIHRVREDLQHSRRSYRDILTHAHRKLRHFRKQANLRAQNVVEEFRQCARAR